jgi:hypothetical protein
MSAKIALMLLALGPLCSLGRAKERPTSISPLNVASSQIYITHVTVIDTETGKEAKDHTVVISGERISEVRDSKDVGAPAAASVMDGTGKYLIPGLWDMHVHALWAPRIDSWMPLLVANGVLGIRDMGSPMKLADVNRLRQEIAEGKQPGPRIVATGSIVDGRKGMTYPRSEFFIEVKTPEEGRDIVRSKKATGSDFVKVYSWLARDVYFAIGDEAKKQDIPFAGHVPFSVPVTEASDAGQKSMEHLHGVLLACSSREDELRGEMLKRSADLTYAETLRFEAYEPIASYSEEKAAKVFAHLAKNGTWQVPTFEIYSRDKLPSDSAFFKDNRLKYIPPSIQQKWREIVKEQIGTPAEVQEFNKAFAKMLEILDKMHKAGIPVLAGTDVGWYNAYSYPGFELHYELQLLVRAGLTPLEALQTATLNSARFLGKTKDLGTIAKGKLADMVLLTANPLEDIRNTEKIDAVFVNGRLLTRRDLDALLAKAETAVKDK